MRIAIGLVLFVAAVVYAQQPVSVWNGVYVQDQASRGKAAFDERCAVCHGSDLAGRNGPPLLGEVFKENWNGLMVDDLFEYIKTSMPRGQVFRFSREQTADVVAFLLTSNGFRRARKSFPTMQRC